MNDDSEKILQVEMSHRQTVFSVHTAQRSSIWSTFFVDVTATTSHRSGTCSFLNCLNQIFWIFKQLQHNFHLLFFHSFSLSPPTSKCTESICFTLRNGTACQSSCNGTYYVDTTKMSDDCVSFSQSYSNGSGLQSVLSSAVGLLSAL